jgi:hypothetical protein
MKLLYCAERGCTLLNPFALESRAPRNLVGYAGGVLDELHV